MDKNCKLCKFGCGNAIPGFGPNKPKLIVISDYPGKKETEEGKPMVGRAGQLLRRALTNIVKLDVENEVFFTNVIRCEPTTTPGKTEISSCKRWTTEEMKNVDCNLILVAGGLAFDTILPTIIQTERLKDDDFNISRAHGSVYNYLGKTYMVTWNPAYVEQYKFKDPRKGTQTPKGMSYPDWFPTGSIPASFMRDMQKLKVLIEHQYGI